ncbi:hypothetical protein Pmani_032729 [Petrolisthes manimaculis]|uniref:Uncharacterized protein n=1 Tax=Petrolisthes manimaculis TaxID=1843537 RepID=A0AAE1TR66_9EUCA|nr:hypothetical protein Pmani_032729 [Petrolisthes manimaculis]
MRRGCRHGEEKEGRKEGRKSQREENERSQRQKDDRGREFRPVSRGEGKEGVEAEMRKGGSWVHDLRWMI